MKAEKKTGRPTKLTPKMRKEIVDLLKAGNYIGTACILAGVSTSTYYRWINAANKSTRPNKYTKFRDEVEKAKAFAEARDVASITKHSEKHWQSAAWRLERKHPESWGKNRIKNPLEDDF